MSNTIRSMTGFGSGAREKQDFRVSVEIRSVNHRYLKLSVHLPEEFSWAQRLVEARIREAFPGAEVLIHQDPYGVEEAHERFA